MTTIICRSSLHCSPWFLSLLFVFSFPCIIEENLLVHSILHLILISLEPVLRRGRRRVRPRHGHCSWAPGVDMTWGCRVLTARLRTQSRLPWRSVVIIGGLSHRWPDQRRQVCGGIWIKCDFGISNGITV